MPTNDPWVEQVQHQEGTDPLRQRRLGSNPELRVAAPAPLTRQKT